MKAEQEKFIEENSSQTPKSSENAQKCIKSAYCKWTLEENLLYIKGLWALRD